MQHQGVSTAVPAESGGEETSPNHSNPDKDRAVVLEKASISNGFKCNDFVNRSFYGPEELKENFFKVFQGASRLEDPSIPPMPSKEKSSTVKARSKNVITFPRRKPIRKLRIAYKAKRSPDMWCPMFSDTSVGSKRYGKGKVLG